MSAANCINFTPRVLNGLNPSAGLKSQEFVDERVRHLKLEATSAGTKSFWFRAQKDGQRFNLHLGHYPATSIEEARKAALELKNQVDRGLDPTAKRKALKTEPTFREFFDEQYVPYAKAHKVSWRDDINRVNHRIGKFIGDRKMSTVTKREIAQYHAALRDELSEASANRILVLISAIFRRALEWEVVAVNPASGIRQFRENNARTRFLDETEVAAFLQSCDYEAETQNRTAADLLKGLLYTGLRKSELKDAKWADLNLERGELRLNRTKNGDGRTVVLSDEGLALLAGLESRGKSEWLFPGRNGKRPLNNLDKPFARVIERAGLAGTDFTIHCLRHTLASHLAIQGCSLHIIGQTLGHRSQAMSARYSHLSNGALRAAVNGAGSIFRQAHDAANASKPAESEAA